MKNAALERHWIAGETRTLVSAGFFAIRVFAYVGWRVALLGAHRAFGSLHKRVMLDAMSSIPVQSFTLPASPIFQQRVTVKIFSDRDLSWEALAGALVLMFIVSSALRGPLPGGPLSARVPMLLQYVGGFLAAAVMGGFIVLVIWLVKRYRRQPYQTPRRDLAAAILLMCVVTFRAPQAAPLPVDVDANSSATLYAARTGLQK